MKLHPTTCPKCEAKVEIADLLSPNKMIASLVVLKDLRIWACAIGMYAALGLLTGLLGWNGTVAASGVGAMVGLVIAIRLGTVRKCPKCSAIDSFDLFPEG